MQALMIHRHTLRTISFTSVSVSRNVPSVALAQLNKVPDKSMNRPLQGAAMQVLNDEPGSPQPPRQKVVRPAVEELPVD